MQRTGETGAVIHAARSAPALPEAFLYGTAYVVETVPDARGRT